MLLPQGEATRLRGTGSLPPLNRGEKRRHWIGEIVKSLPRVGGGEKSLPIPRKRREGTGERRRGAYKTDQNNRHDGPTRAGNFVC